MPARSHLLNTAKPPATEGDPLTFWCGRTAQAGEVVQTSQASQPAPPCPYCRAAYTIATCTEPRSPAA